MATLNLNRRKHADFAGSFASVAIVVCMGVEPANARSAVPFTQTLVLVFIGGSIGALLRGLMMFGVRGADAEPLLLLAINTAGSFALGLLIAWLSTKPLSPRIHHLRALIGTGLIGGFTSYSALAVLTVQLESTNFGLGVAYALATLALGVGAAWAGVALGNGLSRSTKREIAS